MMAHATNLIKHIFTSTGVVGPHKIKFETEHPRLATTKNNHRTSNSSLFALSRIHQENMFQYDTSLSETFSNNGLSQAHVSSSIRHPSNNESACFESYQLFKKCLSQSRGTEGFNCTAVVSSYMVCTLGSSKCHL
eukprot:CCRYP_013642-RA/>CCRYP_013642-RA protein AED:0.30 eAED:0.30 QI:296/1/1/1/0/0/2/118/134